MTNDSAILTRKLLKRFPTTAGPVIAVDSVDLAVERGETFGLIGPDGAGKTTLTRVLLGLLSRSGGESRILGYDSMADTYAIRERVGYIAQRFALPSDMTVMENLCFFAGVQGVSRADQRQRIPRLLEFAGLSQFTGRLGGRLSGGMRKKLALACSLIHEPQVVLLDEPTLGVDPVSRREFWNLLGNLRAEKGLTIFVCTPYMDEAERCNRVGLMYRGRMIACDTPAAIKRRVPGRLLEFTPSRFEAAQRLVAGIKGVTELQTYGMMLHAFVDDPEEHRPMIEAALAGQGIACTGMREIAPRMEEAFISLITRQTREGIMTPNEYAIESDGLTKRFGKFVAVDQVSFGVRPGEVYGWLGPNGAGKTTTIRMLLGLLKPSAGQARVLGYDPARQTKAMQARVGYMSQLFTLYNDLTANENIRFYGLAYGLSRADLRQRQAEILAMAGLAGRGDTLTANLSGGWKQRLALGCAIVHRPQVIFLDEPTAGVDPISRRQFWSLIYRMAEQGVTIMVTTHYMDEAELCQRVGFISQGRLLALDTPARLKETQMRGQVLEISTTDADQTMRVLKAAQASGRLPLDEVALYGAQVHAVVPSAQALMEPLLTLLQSEGVHVQAIEWIAPTLEDVFISAVGSHARV